MARADEALHQLVGDIIVLGQELAGEVERDRVGSVAPDDALKAVGDAVERDRPVDAREAAVELPQHVMQHALVEPQRLAERRALGADAAEIGGMVRIAGDGGAAVAVGLRQHAAAHAAIRAGGAHGRRLRGGGVHRYAATLVASARPNMRSSRMCATEEPARMRSRYQSPSAVSPNSTAPTRR